MVYLKQSAIEAKLWLRRRETVIFSLLLPVLFLWFFGGIYGNDKIPGTHGTVKYIDYIVPGYAVYAIMAIALGTISANIANDRFFKILKRLGGTPLPRSVLVASKVTAAGMLAAGVIGVLVLVGILVYHVELHWNQFAAILVLALGTVVFATMGITLGGILKAEAAVAAGSLLYLALSFLGGVFVPRYNWGGGLKAFSQYLPSERMVHAMQVIWTNGAGLSAVGQDLLVMAIWAAGALLVASRWFRWE